MTDPGDLLVLVQTWAKVEWYRCTGGIRDDGQAVPPLIVWRYSDPTQPTRDLVRAAVEGRIPSIGWYYAKPGRNWVLTPMRVVVEQEARSLPTDSAAINWLVEHDQDFCRASLKEFGEIVSDLRSLDEGG